MAVGRSAGRLRFAAWPGATRHHQGRRRRRRACHRPRSPTRCAASRPRRRPRSACARRPSELGYTGNAVARALRPGAHRAGRGPGRLARRTWASSASSQRSASRSGATTCTWCWSTPAASPSASGRSRASSPTSCVDGLVVSPLDPSDAGVGEIGEVLPIVTVGDALAGPTVGEVLFDNRAGVALVLEHLHGLGHRHIAVLTPSRPSTPSGPPSASSARSARRRSGSRRRWSTRAHSIEDATAPRARCWRATRGRPPSSACRTRSPAASTPPPPSCGLAIPGDLSVAGYDDHPIAPVLAPPLTTVDWGMADVATSAADCSPPRWRAGRRAPVRARVRVAPVLVQRASTAPPA